MESLTQLDQVVHQPVGSAGIEQTKTATSDGSRSSEPFAKEFGMGVRSKTKPKRSSKSNTKREYPRTRRSIARLLSVTEQRTFCGCRGITGDFNETNVSCPLGFPWLCGGITATERDSPPACNTGVSLDSSSQADLSRE